MKFNQKVQKKGKILNHEGAEAFTLNPQLELYSATVTSSLNPSFYETGQERLERIRALIEQNDPLFVAKLAVYTREKMYLRSMPLVLAVELAKVHSGDNLISRLVARIVQRADEITELLAYYQKANDRQAVKKLGKLSKQLQKGLAQAFNRFDEYQFAKYNRPAEVKLKDALFLVHPKPKDEAQQMLFDKIVEDRLEVPYTWEVELSVLGQQSFKNEAAKQVAVRAKWTELIESGKLGYMALLRNLRNILQSGVGTQCMQSVAERLADKRQVTRAKQLPFRFLSAYREIKSIGSPHTTMILNALEKAIQASVENLQGFDEDTRVLIACDTSGSMCQPISPRSSVQLYDIGLVLGMVLQSKVKLVNTGIFGDRWKIINLPQTHILANADALRSRMGEVGYSTNGYLVIQDLIKRKQIVDKVMIFTDMQLWNSHYNDDTIAKEWAKYRQIAPKARLYLFDLAGYGQAPLRVEQQGVSLIAGWSDKVFEVLQAIERGESALAEIQQVSL